ncbi:MAG TPA: hypothetical protein VJ183_13550 [Chloroflexia bacterium]|nr:hypothetical protein [Chloroflexia bacterium]
MLVKKGFLGAILGLMVLILVACDQAGPTPATPTVVIPATPATPTIPITTPTAPVTIPTTTVAATSAVTTTSRPTAPAGWDAKITYEVTGGIDGTKRTLLVGPAGQARLIEGSGNSGPVRLTAERLAQIKSKLDAVGFFNLQERYGTGTVSDDFYITLSLTQDTRTKTVTVEQIGGQGVTPQALLDLISDLEVLRTEIEARNTPTATPDANSWNSKLSYGKSGGIAGVVQTLDIDEQGKATFTDRGTVREASPAAETLAQITSKLDAVHFFTLQDSYGTPIPDGFVFVITLTQGGRTKSVTLAQVIDDVVPPGVQELFGYLESVAEDVRSMATPVVTP